MSEKADRPVEIVFPVDRGDVLEIDDSGLKISGVNGGDTASIEGIVRATFVCDRVVESFASLGIVPLIQV